MSKSSPRQFRGSESLAAEQRSRATVRPFLEACGFVVTEARLIPTGAAFQQIVSFHTPDGDDVKARVRLCWRRDGRNQNEQKYSAAQLTASLRPGGWDATLEYVKDRDLAQGITHNLLFQRDGETVVYAALIPIGALHPIWNRQREVSDELLRRGLKGSITKNHAQNGKSPTLWLQDDRMPDTLRIPRHSDTQPTLIRTPVPRSFGQAVGAQRRRGGIVSPGWLASSISASVCALIHPSD
ncbi:MULTISPECIES: hypothetical protein [Pseudomonas]|uniref:hypothetical protein n=1 Tax=Pseudomonas TaxID=286 RepID=UPI001D2DEE34|nr:MULTISPECIES: hypothetical protein [Pseudomonas]MBP2086358.1 hypothetical protein [Pseudomonas sp. PvP089]MBP2092654.1 hypothetical protein [Pseudomonas sp. PvP088]MBP2226528.1 hypothetical protein [Pseudomonas putida]